MTQYTNLDEYVYNGIQIQRANPEQKRNMVQKYVCYYLEMFKHMPKTFYQIFSSDTFPYGLCKFNGR